MLNPLTAQVDLEQVSGRVVGAGPVEPYGVLARRGHLEPPDSSIAGGHPVAKIVVSRFEDQAVAVDLGIGGAQADRAVRAGLDQAGMIALKRLGRRVDAVQKG